MRKVIKRVIGGKRYDTSTAELIGGYSEGAASDFRHVSEDLYKKRTGEFFLYGSGGPKTEYRERVDYNSWGWGERIVPMSYDEAKTWAEEHLDVDAYEKAFGEVKDDDTNELVGVYLPKALAEKLRRRAAQEGKQFSAVAVDALTAWLE